MNEAQWAEKMAAKVKEKRHQESIDEGNPATRRRVTSSCCSEVVERICRKHTGSRHSL